MAKTTAKKNTTKNTTRTQTVRINGARVRLVTKDGKVTVKKAPVLEIDLQIAAVKAIKKLPGYITDAASVRPGTFTLAADQNGSGFRGRNAAVKLKAAGMAAGEPDVRLNFYGGVVRYIEFKGERGKLELSQEVRFPLLRALGFVVEEVKASTCEDAADKAVAMVRGWLAENENSCADAKKAA